MSAEAIRAAEEARIASLLGGDLQSFADLCDDRLVFTHSVGRRDNKESTLQALRTGELRYVAMDHDLENIQVLGDTACAFGNMRAQIETNAGSVRLDSLTTSVWTRVESRWLLIAFQSTARA